MSQIDDRGGNILCEFTYSSCSKIKKPCDRYSFNLNEEHLVRQIFERSQEMFNNTSHQFFKLFNYSSCYFLIDQKSLRTKTLSIYTHLNHVNVETC